MASEKTMRRRLARLPGVQAAVQANGAEVEARAKAMFASHDRPGGHRIGSRKRGVDRLVYMSGPAPLSVEYGHFAGPQSLGPDREYVSGLHIMSKAARG